MRSGIRPLAVLATLAVILLAAALIGGTVWFGSFIRGEAFRNLVAESTGKAFDSKATLAPLRWSGSSAYSENLTLSGAPSSSFKVLNAGQVRAEVNWRALFSGAWRVEDLTVTRLDVEWQQPGPRPGAEVPAPVPPPPSGLAAYLPNRFELGLLSVSSAHLRVRDVEVTNCALKVRPDGNGWIFEGKGGRLSTPWTPALNIIDFRAREQKRDIYLTRGNLSLGANGKISVSGDSTGGGNLKVTWDGVDSRDLLSGWWTKHLTGTLTGSLDFSSPDRLKGTCALKDGRLENIPMLATVADFTRNPAFRKMPLQEMRGDFVREATGWKITNFSAESKGLLRVEGTAFIGHDRSLNGRFQIGVTGQTLQWLPGSRERVFTAARDGYLWTDLRIEGTLDKPTEDLSGRLVTAMGGEVIRQGAEVIEKVPGTAVDSLKGAIDILRSLVP